MFYEQYTVPYSDYSYGYTDARTVLCDSEYSK